MCKFFFFVIAFVSTATGLAGETLEEKCERLEAQIYGNKNVAKKSHVEIHMDVSPTAKAKGEARRKEIHARVSARENAQFNARVTAGQKLLEQRQYRQIAQATARAELAMAMTCIAIAEEEAMYFPNGRTSYSGGSGGFAAGNSGVSASARTSAGNNSSNKFPQNGAWVYESSPNASIPTHGAWAYGK